LHHFEDAKLAELLRLIAERASLFIASNASRGVAVVLQPAAVAIGCNEVTRHDAVVSVRAGFSGGELSALWPDKPDWRLRNSAPGCSATFSSRRKSVESWPKTTHHDCRRRRGRVTLGIGLRQLGVPVVIHEAGVIRVTRLR